MENKWQKYLMWIGMLCIALVQQVSAVPKPTITYLGIENGLSNNAVNCIFQDHKGFMWFGTYDGLNRYDGTGFKIFRNKFSDSNSLVNNWIFAINEDANNNVWIGTRQGLCFYNTVSDKFYSAYYTPSGGGQRKNIVSVIRDIKRDRDGNMLVATEDLGLFFFKKGAATAIQVPVIQGTRAETAFLAQKIEIDDNNNTWLFISNKGLCRFDSRSKQIKVVNETILSAGCMEADSEYLWVGADDGLYKYHIPTNTYTGHYNQTAGELTHARLTSL